MRRQTAADGRQAGGGRWRGGAPSALRRLGIGACTAVVACELGAQGRTVDYPAAARPAANWMLRPRPVIDLGGEDAEGPTAFGEIMGLARLANGDVVVADGSNTLLRVFRPDGAFVRRMGRKGPGPGEFNFLWSLATLGDTIFAADNTGGAERVTMYAIKR